MRKRNTIEDCNRLAKDKNGKCLSTKYIYSKTKYLWECEFSHQWKASHNNINNGRWCPFCAAAMKLTMDNCYQLAKSKNGKCLSVEYINNITKLLWECDKGHQWKASYSNVNSSGTWCPYCSNHPSIIKFKINDCYKLAEQKNGECLSIEYINAKYLWKCDKGHIWEAAYSSIKKGTWCLLCNNLNKLKYSLNDCHKLAYINNGKFLNTEYTGAHSKYLWECKEKHQWYATYNNVNQGTWCPYCAKCVKLTIDNCHKLAKLRDGKCLSTEYINVNTKYLWECGNFHKWWAAYYSVKLGHWCPKCKNKSQNRIFEICMKLFPDYKIEYNFRDLYWLKTKKGSKLELDIYIPELKLAIEYDGKQHFKPVTFGNISIKRAEENLKTQQERDMLKNQKIAEHPEDVKYFIRFDYMEYLTKKYIIEKITQVLKV